MNQRVVQNRHGQIRQHVRDRQCVPELSAALGLLLRGPALRGGVTGGQHELAMAIATMAYAQVAYWTVRRQRSGCSWWSTHGQPDRAAGGTEELQASCHMPNVLVRKRVLDDDREQAH